MAGLQFILSGYDLLSLCLVMLLSVHFQKAFSEMIVFDIADSCSSAKMYRKAGESDRGMQMSRNQVNRLALMLYTCAPLSGFSQVTGFSGNESLI